MKSKKKVASESSKPKKTSSGKKHFNANYISADKNISTGKLPDIPRMPTGIAGLDAILQGGLPSGSVNLLSGSCGTGKSTLAMQFIYNGAKYYDEPGVYVTLEEEPKKLIRDSDLFNWNIEEMIEKKKMVVIKPEIYKFDSLKQVIGDAIERIGAKRLVVDSYSVLLTYFSDPAEIRDGLVQLDREIKKMNCTALIISDIKDNSEVYSTTGVEEFIVDGVIVLYLKKDLKRPDESVRAISVRKMRATKYPLKTYSFQIGPSGILLDAHISAGMKGKGVSFARTTSGKKQSKNVKPVKNVIDVNQLRNKNKHSWKWKYL